MYQAFYIYYSGLKWLLIASYSNASTITTYMIETLTLFSVLILSTSRSVRVDAADLHVDFQLSELHNS